MLLTIVALIALLMAFLGPALIRINNTKPEITTTFNIGDTVYIGGLDITGRVIYFGAELVDMLVKGTNSIPTKLMNIPIKLINKAQPTVEKN